MIPVMSQPPAIPADLDCSSWPTLEPFYRALIDRSIASEGDFWDWLRDLSALGDIVSEYAEWAAIRHTCHTDDPEVERAYRYVVEHLEPQSAPLYVDLQKKFLADATRLGVQTDGRIAHLVRLWQAEVDAYRPENIPLLVQATTLASAYDKACGAMVVTFQGTEQTLQQVTKQLDGNNRSVREAAWRSISERWLQDRALLDSTFDQLVQVRDQIGRNAGHADYRSYTWLVKKRFDYTPDMCLEFGAAIEELVVPVLDDLDNQTARNLGVPRLRPWDRSVDPQDRAPLRPFPQDDMAGFVSGTRRMLHRVSPYFAGRFATMTLGKTLDLESRPGKQPGGYQAWLPVSRTPFIFMNAVGSQRDVEVLLHESGHALHAFEASDHVDVPFARRAPSEFNEVASMSMELLAADLYDEFYSPADARRAKRLSLEGPLRLLPRVAAVDGFQHWIYTNPGHTATERTDAWLALQDRFGGRAVDWSGVEEVRATWWHRTLHLFAYPFYYIEYGIAQLGALQLWLQYKRDPDTALADYRRALALGGTRPLPELFGAAGLSFDFSAKTLAPLVRAVRDELV